MISTDLDQEAIISDITRKLAPYDIRNNGPYPETEKGLRRAAVLLPITIHNSEIVILLTKRSKNLKSHPSAVAFPGGNRDETDVSDIDTALREAKEEIGLPPEKVKVLAILTRGVHLPNMVVYPVVGWIPSDFVPVVNPSEVEFAFYFPLKDFIAEEKISYHTFSFQGSSFLLPSLDYSSGDLSAKIWGFTARYCILLAKIIFDTTGSVPVFDDRSKEKSKGLCDDLVRYFEFVTSNFHVKSNM